MEYTGVMNRIHLTLSDVPLGYMSEHQLRDGNNCMMKSLSSINVPCWHGLGTPREFNGPKGYIVL